MAATVKTRIQLKCDTEENWNKASRFIPLKGELIVYSADESHPFSRIKIGDGVTNINLLPFISADYINGYQIKVDTTANWQQNINYIPNKGDIIIWSDKAIVNKIYPGIKIGDGLAYNVDLPFVGDDIIELLNAHIDDNIRHITAEERAKWNNKINCEDIVVEETLILNRN